jgi:hypothetical protein
MERQLYIVQNQERKGPFPESQVRAMLAAGTVRATDMVWHEGLPSWTPASQVIVTQNDFLGIPDIPDFRPPPMPANYAAKERRSVGGWLLVFCIIVIAIGPLMTFASMSSDWQKAQPVFEQYPAMRTIVFLENCAMGLISLSGAVVGIVILTGSPSGKKVAQGYLIGRLCFFLLVEIIATSMVTASARELTPFIVGAIFGVCIREFIFFAIWFSYFVRSKRVQETYGD